MTGQLQERCGFIVWTSRPAAKFPRFGNNTGSEASE
jgi:hypothetical protein